MLQTKVCALTVHFTKECKTLTKIRLLKALVANVLKDHRANKANQIGSTPTLSKERKHSMVKTKRMTVVGARNVQTTPKSLAYPNKSSGPHASQIHVQQSRNFLETVSARDVHHTPGPIKMVRCNKARPLLADLTLVQQLRSRMKMVLAHNVVSS